MLLKFYFPKKEFKYSEIDEQTLQEGGHTWFPPTVCWLDKLGLKVKLYLPASLFDYKKFSEKGKGYLNTHWSEERYLRERNSGSLQNIDRVQNFSKIMVKKKLWTSKRLSDDELTNKLKDEQTLAVGKTIHEWLSGNYTSGSAHYVLIQKRYSEAQWKIHDPGLPPYENRKVVVSINGHSMFGDILVVSGLKK
jgi:hypothetical protein